MDNINSVKIIGTLSKADVKEITSKNGGQYISVEAQVESNGNTFDIRFFSGRTKQDGSDNPTYDTFANLPHSINTKVSILGELQENPWYDAKNNVVKTSMRINGRFISPARFQEVDSATFTVTGFVLSPLTEKKNKDGVAYRYDINIGVPNYNDTKIQNITLNTSVTPEPGTTDPYYSAELVSALSTLKAGQSVQLEGELTSTITTETIEEKHGFGKPTYKTYTNVNRRYNITSGDTITEGALDQATIRDLVASYKASLAEVQAKGAERATSKTTSTSTSVSQPEEMASLL